MNQEFTLGNHSAFELIEYWPAAISAGYTQEDIKYCNVFAGPTYDDENFYYCANFGSPLTGAIKPSILVCRRKSDNSMVYAVNCQTFNLDTGATYFGPSRMICRPAPVLKGDKLYLVSGFVSNIGPQLFCVNKHTGELIYAIAYDIPYEVEQELGIKQITVQKDYSQFVGSNARLNNCGPVVKGKRIYLGLSSAQNYANVGLIPGNPNFTGYPYFTDQGTLTCVRERMNEFDVLVPEVESRVSACAPPFRIGDKLSTNNPVKNPFMPGANSVLIATISNCKIRSPGAIDGKYNFAQKAFLSSTTVINDDLFAKFWKTVGNVIYLTNPANTTTGPHTFVNVLSILSGLVLDPTAVAYTISASLSDVSNIVGKPVTGQLALWYVKELFPGHELDSKYDANALSYWGNSIWGETPYIDDNKILFGTGQSHSSPLSERLYFSNPNRNYRLSKTNLVDLINAYVLNPSQTGREHVKNEKIAFNTKMRNLAIQAARSHPGQMSYSDSIIAAKPKTLEMLYAVRSIPCDVYTFLGKLDPLGIFPNPSLDVDGDISAGIFQTDDKLIAGVAKHGAACVVDISGYNHLPWNHGTPISVGVNYVVSVYVGPNGNLGGTNYASSFNKNKSMLVGLSTNQLFSGGSTGSDGQLEKFVTTDGVHVPAGNSVAFGFEFKRSSVSVKWYTPLSGTQAGTTTAYKNVVFTCDGNGKLLVLNVNDGTLNQSIDAASDPHAMFGGIAKPVVDKEESKVYWIASYSIPPFDSLIRKYGWVLNLN